MDNKQAFLAVDRGACRPALDNSGCCSGKANAQTNNSFNTFWERDKNEAEEGGKSEERGCWKGEVGWGMEGISALLEFTLAVC